MRGIEKMSEFAPDEFWWRCEESWHELWILALEEGNVGLAEFWRENAQSAMMMALTV